MSYITLDELDAYASHSDLVALSTGSGIMDIESIFAELSESADAEIDMWSSTATWTSKQRKMAAAALIILAFWERRSTVEAPSPVVERAKRIRSLFLIKQTVGFGITFDPTLDETDEELTQLAEGFD